MSNLPQRLGYTFFAPGKLGDEIREEPRWLGALLAGALVVGVANFLIPLELFEEMIRQQILQAGGEVPPDMESVAKVGRLWALAAGLIFWFVWTFVMGGLVTLVLGVVLGDQGRFKQYLSLVAHALFIAAVGGLLVLPLKILTGDLRLTLSLGTFLEPVLGEGYLLRMARGVDLFSLWAYGVVAAGAIRIDPRGTWVGRFLPLLVLVILTAAAFALIPS